MTRRLLLSYLTVTVLVLVLLEVPLALFYSQRERERVEADLEHDANVLASLYEDAVEMRVPLDPRPAEAYEARTGARVVIVDDDGVSLVDTGQATNRDFSTRPEIALALAGTSASGTRSSDTLATEILYVAVPVASGGVVHGALRITLDTSDVTDRIHRFWLALIGIAAIVLVVVGLIGWGIARSVTRPLRRLTAAAARYASGDLQVAEESGTGPREIRALADTMSMMARRLDELLQSQRSFVADASHQLRTPLTAIRLRLENLQSRVPAQSVGEMDALIEETDRLAGLVGDLLQLARADESAAPEVADLAGLASDRIDTWTAVAEAVSVVLLADVPPSPTLVMAVPGGIEQILDNLLDNALTVSPPDGTITVRVAARPDGVDLVVVDQGPGLTDEQKAHATQRFWRGTASADGTGLGLAIVESIAVASGGSVRLDDAPGSGLSVTVSLAAAQPHGVATPR